MKPSPHSGASGRVVRTRKIDRIQLSYVPESRRPLRMLGLVALQLDQILIEPLFKGARPMSAIALVNS